MLWEFAGLRSALVLHAVPVRSEDTQVAARVRLPSALCDGQPPSGRADCALRDGVLSGRVHLAARAPVPLGRSRHLPLQRPLTGALVAWIVRHRRTFAPALSLLWNHGFLQSNERLHDRPTDATCSDASERFASARRIRSTHGCRASLARLLRRPLFHSTASKQSDDRRRIFCQFAIFGSQPETREKLE